MVIWPILDLADLGVSATGPPCSGNRRSNIEGMAMDSLVPLMIGFNVFVLAMLALDLGFLHVRREAIPPRRAMLMCFGYMAVAAAFGAGVIRFMGAQAGYEFYIIEQSLSVDNMFVFLLIFTHFNIQPKHQHRVLFYGVLGALAMRGLFIYTGVTLVSMSHWVLAVFGVFLLLTSIKMLISIEQEPDIERNRILLFARKRLRMADDSPKGKFFVRKGRFLYATPIFLVLILVETTDIIFAFDSIPAIFAVTQDPFIIYTSNVFAILGLRALYFALAGAMNNFHYLKYGVSLTLMMIGIKMTYGWPSRRS
jgi:tellurite resistance protein TerC